MHTVCKSVQYSQDSIISPQQIPGMLSTLQTTNRAGLVTFIPLHLLGPLQHPLLATHTVELVPQAKDTRSVTDHHVRGEGDRQAVDQAAGDRRLQYKAVLCITVQPGSVGQYLL